MSAASELRLTAPRANKIEDPCQSQWVNLFPPLKDRDVLKLGTRRGDNIQALDWISNGRLTCVPSSDSAPLPGATIRLRRVEQLQPDSYDLAILDESEWLLDENAPLGTIFTALRAGGYILLCLPRDMRHIRARATIFRFLQKAGFERVQRYLCEPSHEQPLRIIELDEAGTWTARYLTSGLPYWERYKSVAHAKTALKKRLFRVLRANNPWFGLLLVARKPGAGSWQETWRERMERSCAAGPKSGRRTGLVLTAQSDNARQLAFLYDRDSGETLAVGKLARRRYADAHLLEMKQRNRGLAETVNHELANKGVSVPPLLDSWVTERLTWFVLPGLNGELRQSVARCLMDGHREALGRLLAAAAEASVALERELTRKLMDSADRLRPEFFENYLGLPLPSLPSLTPRVLVQHGDFSADNLFLDPATRKWSVIDWEWLAAGYPPLFDIYSLLRSVGFVDERGGHIGGTSQFVRSVQDTFFSKNWFSQLAVPSVLWACDRGGHDRERLFEYFLAFLLVRCNRLRVGEHWRPEQLQNWESAARFAVQHRSEFLSW